MTAVVQAYQEERIALADTELYLLKGEEGRPLLVLHGLEGHEGWRPLVSVCMRSMRSFKASMRELTPLNIVTMAGNSPTSST